MSDLVEREVVVEKEKKKEYRLNTAQVFLTYSQCPVELDELLKFLNLLVKIDKYIIAQEKHVDGNLHIHVYLLLEKKINIRDPRFFDYREYHPKVEGVRSYKNVIKYVTKDGKYLTNYDKEILAKIISDSMKQSELYTNARKRAKEGNVKEAMEMLEHPKTVRDLCLHGNTIRQNLESLVPKRPRVVFPLDDFNIDFVWDMSRTLILWGPTNTGKTSLAKAFLPRALFVSHFDRLRDYNPIDYHGIIFDDMSFKHIPRESQIHLVDYNDDRDIHCRYTPAFIPAHTPKIITSNSHPLDILLVDDPAITRRVQAINITDVCYKNAYSTPVTTPVITPDVTTTTTTTTVSPPVFPTSDYLTSLLADDEETQFPAMSLAEFHRRGRWIEDLE